MTKPSAPSPPTALRFVDIADDLEPYLSDVRAGATFLGAHAEVPLPTSAPTALPAPATVAAAPAAVSAALTAAERALQANHQPVLRETYVTSLAALDAEDRLQHQAPALTALGATLDTLQATLAAARGPVADLARHDGGGGGAR